MIPYRSNPIKFHENFFTGPEQISDDIQILRVGTFFHEGQPVQITKKDLKTMRDNFKNNVRGIDIMLDYSHNSEGEAAAWFQELYLSENGSELWAKVDWTETGADSVRKKKYRYVSADFNFAYKDNESLKEYGPTLLGAGLTNRPVVKNMNPTVLSEDKNNNKEYGMTLEEMKKELEEMKKENKELKEKLAEKDKNLSESALKEREEKLAEKEKAVKLSEEKIEKEKIENEKKAEFDTMLSEGKAVEAQREAYIKGDMAEFVKNAVDPKTLNFSEKGDGTNNGDNKNSPKTDTPAQDEVISLAEKKVKEDGVDLGEGISLVLSENSELAEKYKKETEE